jgi:hypothetical protein
MDEQQRVAVITGAANGLAREFAGGTGRAAAWWPASTSPT